MRLTWFLLRKKMPPGNIWLGKHRIVHRPNEMTVNRMHKRFELEEQNMFYLRHPFLTVEQNHGYAKELGKVDARKAAIKEMNNNRPYRPNVRLEDRLTAALITSKAWE